jgi:hypothetical protein
MQHRDIDYSIAQNSVGTWRWTLHPTLRAGVRVQFGEGATEEAAINGAKAAIDKMLDQI